MPRNEPLGSAPFVATSSKYALGVSSTSFRKEQGPPVERTRRRRRRPRVVVIAPLAVLLVGALAIAWPFSSSSSKSQSNATGVTITSTPITTAPADVRPVGKQASLRRLVLYKTVGGAISPKSVVATNTGMVLAQNMMYRHSVTVYGSAGGLRKTVSDAVTLSQFGVTGHPGVSHGAPVEAAVTPDGNFAWISNYSMYGAGFGPEGSDECSPSSARAAGVTDSFVYRLNLTTLSIDAVARAGMVPKYLAVTPNGRYLVVSNWCSWDAVVIDLTGNKVVARIPIGAYPRGIAISPDSQLAYIAIMGSSVLDIVNLSTMKVVGQISVGSNVRHVVMSPTDNRLLYVSLNASGVVEKVNRLTRQVIGRVHTGSGCRTLAISADGTALFVVNYDSNTMTMLRASDLHILQTVRTGTHPVGVTYDAITGRVWVAVYTGEIMIYDTK